MGGGYLLAPPPYKLFRKFSFSIFPLKLESKFQEFPLLPTFSEYFKFLPQMFLYPALRKLPIHIVKYFIKLTDVRTINKIKGCTNITYRKDYMACTEIYYSLTTAYKEGFSVFIAGGVSRGTVYTGILFKNKNGFYWIS